MVISFQPSPQGLNKGHGSPFRSLNLFDSTGDFASVRSRPKNMEEVPRIADYLVIAGLPKDDRNLQLLDEYSLEVNLKQSAHQDPITDITVRKRASGLY